jgi:hypothetical protein
MVSSTESARAPSLRALEHFFSGVSLVRCPILVAGRRSAGTAAKHGSTGGYSIDTLPSTAITRGTSVLPL